MIAYYAHQHGSGHSNCAQIVAQANPKGVIVLTSYPFAFNVDTRAFLLPSEDPDGTGLSFGQQNPPEYLHYSPVGQKSIQQRSAMLINTCLENDVKLMIIDVSVEVAALSRAASIPYAYVRLPGIRSDYAHLQAFQGAVVLLAYFPEKLEAEDTPQWIREKTVYIGFLSRFTTEMHAMRSKKINKIVVLSGRGGNERLLNSLPLIIQRFQGANLDIFGDYNQTYPGDTISCQKHTPEIEGYLKSADLIITSCGLNTISELLHLKKPIISIAENRPYDEQICFEHQLVKHKLVCTFDFALSHNDEDILKSTIDPSSYLVDNKLDHFLNSVLNSENDWSENYRKKI